MSVYSCCDAVEDGATLRNVTRTASPRLKLVNEDIAEELGHLLEEAAFDEDDGNRSSGASNHCATTR